MGLSDSRPARFCDAAFRVGFQLSLLFHLLGLLVALGFVQVPKFSEPVVYSVTLEGGARLGGIMQAPPEKEEVRQVPVAVSEPKAVAVPPPVEVADKDTVVLKPEATPIPERTVKPEKTIAKPTPVPAKTAAPVKTAAKPREPTLAEINKQLELATRQYTGESANAGGTGYGAAREGGKGMGGGVLVPREVLDYLRTVERRVKTGWRWFDPKANLRAAITFQISETGEISEVVISQSSGNAAFDDSVVRAIKKANPLPVPPPAAFEHIQNGGGARVTFDPRQL